MFSSPARWPSAHYDVKCQDFGLVDQYNARCQALSGRMWSSILQADLVEGTVEYDASSFVAMGQTGCQALSP